MKRFFSCLLISVFIFMLFSHASAYDGEGASVYNDAYTIPNATWTAFQFDTEIEDDNNYWSAGTPGCLTTPAAAWYYVNGYCRSNSTISAGYMTRLSIARASVLYPIDTELPGILTTHYPSTNYLIRAASSQCISLRIYQNSGSSQSYKCWFNIVRINEPLVDHASTHENLGSDQIDVGNLDGRLSDPQNADALCGTNVNISGPAVGHLLRWCEGGYWCDSFSLPSHNYTHQDGGTDEINVGDLSGLLADPQDAGWLQDLAISTTDPTDNQVLVWNDAGSQWEPGDLGEATLPEFITATLSGTLPVVITSTYHYTAELNSGHDVAVIRSFTYGEMAIALALFSLLGLFGLRWVFELVK